MSEDPDRFIVRFPAWSAPLVGSCLVGLAGVWFALRLNRPVTLAWLGGHALIGFLIGCAVWAVDGPGEGETVPRFLALLSPLVALLPIFGLPFTFAAIRANRTRRDYHWYMSRIGWWLSLLVTAVFVVALLLSFTTVR